MSWIENPPVVVVVAKYFNPSIPNPIWLSKNEILNNNGDYKEESVFSSKLMQAVTEEFILVMTPDQMQFIPLVPPAQRSEIIEDKLGKLFRKLTEVPYRAIGLNFNWHKIPEEKQLSDETRKMFGGRNDGVFSRFTDSTAMFGAYFSKSFGPFRMKLDVKPISVESDSSKEERIQFGFNFHHDLSLEDSSSTQLCDLIGQWSSVRTEAVESIKTVGYQE